MGVDIRQAALLGTVAAGVVVVGAFLRRRRQPNTTQQQQTQRREMIASFAPQSTPPSPLTKNTSPSATVSTIVPCSSDDCDAILRSARVIERQCVVGLDVEWFTPPKAAAVPGSKRAPRQHPGRAAVVQLTTDEWTLVVPVLRFGHFPHELRRILESDQVLKVGVGIRGDVLKLLSDWQVHCAACVNVQRVAAAARGFVPGPPHLDRVREHLLPDGQRRSEGEDECASGVDGDDSQPRRPIPQGLSLKKLLLERFGVVLDKSLARSNWAQSHLTDDQLRYAALDAAASRAVFVAYWRDLLLASDTTVPTQLACLDTAIHDSLADCGDITIETLKPWFEVVRAGHGTAKTSSATSPCNSIGCVIAHEQGGHHHADNGNARATRRLQLARQRAEAAAAVAAAKEHKRQRFERFSKWAARKSQLYQNIPLMAPDGVKVAMIPTKKLKWYVGRELADVVIVNGDDSTDLSQHTLVPDIDELLDSYGEEEGALPPNIGVRLRFEPRGRTHAGQVEGQKFYLSDKKNQCVVCASAESLVKHYVVPHEYRKHFPLAFKNRSSHDIVLMCTTCWDGYIRTKHAFKKQLLIEYGICTQEQLLSNSGKFSTDKHAFDARRAAGALLVHKGRPRKSAHATSSSKKSRASGKRMGGSGERDGGPGNTGNNTGNTGGGAKRVSKNVLPASRVRELAETILHALEERREFIVDQEGEFEDCDADLLISSLTSAHKRPSGGDVIDADDDDEEEAADDDRFVQGIRVETVQDALRKLSRVNCKVPSGDFVPLSKRLVARVLAGHTSAQSAPESNDVSELDDAGSRGGEATAATTATVAGASLLAQRDRCQQFVERWRTHFVDHTQPKFMPNGWSVKFQVEMNADG